MSVYARIDLEDRFEKLISLPGSGEDPRAPVFIDGERATLLEGPTIADDFVSMVEDYVEKRWG